MSARALLRGASREGLTKGIRYAKVAGMNSPEWHVNHGGGGLSDLIWRRPCFGRAGVCDEGLYFVVRGVEG